MSANLPSPAATPPPRAMQTAHMSTENIYKIYEQHVRISEPPLPPYLAAVRTLTAALSQTEQALPTLAETLALLSSLSTTLKTSLPAATAIAISAGTDTFQRQLVTGLARGQPDAQVDAPSNDSDTRNAVIKAGEGFIQRHLAQRARIANYGSRFVRPGMTLVVPSSSPSRNVESILRSAADADIPFRVLFVGHDRPDSIEKTPNYGGMDNLRSYLHERETPTAKVPATGLAHALRATSSYASPDERHAWPPHQTVLLADAVALLASGGMLSTLETQTAAAVARALGREVWAVAETGKCVRHMGIEGSLGASQAGEAASQIVRWEGAGQHDTTTPAQGAGLQDMLDVTPAEFLTGIITEDGPKSTSAIAEEAIKIWF